ncbi:Eco29kI family restriction endonuclease [Corynebacterium variabile]|uniref:Eco29kI family restriction endonuclease n=2 Tax=Corynebacterium variabile TaxID=1727 RepID=UPI002648DE59|nr:Eco29kI family restriction endonuclease [Corynebacterium variabile]MDN6478191.1 Eco29kI family restriction endonuclease [Corynebacterium variabile]
MAFDPLSYENLGESITRALDAVEPVKLTDLAKFPGAGIYALYYLGDFEPYRLLAEVNRNEETGPTKAIYIGKAEAENSRTGKTDQTSDAGAKPKLYDRIQDHRKSIEAAVNLDVEDFMVRALTVAPTWIPLAEVVSIRVHSPVWNSITVGGLGNHNPGSGRAKGKRSPWDTLHPGRSWAADIPDGKATQDEVAQGVRDYLRVHNR